VVLWGLGAWLGASDGKSGWWGGFRTALWKGGDVTHVSEKDYFSDLSAMATAGNASTGLWIAGGTVLAFLLLVLAIQKRGGMVYFLFAVGVLELVVFAGRHRVSFSLSSLNYRAQAEAVGENAGQLRAIDVTGSNRGMLTGISDLWGDDPGVLARYAEFMAMTQGLAPDEATQHVVVKTPHVLWRMLRGEYVFQPNPEGGVLFQSFSSEPLRRFELVPEVAVMTGRDAIFQALASESFDPTKTVILEEAPEIGGPTGGEMVSGEWVIEKEDTDEVVVSVETASPAVLLMTDPFSRGWRVRNLASGAPQPRYELLPANYVLRGIPLEAGKHRLRIYYRPRTLTLGILISSMALVGCVGGLIWFRPRSRRARG
jgi:hypothetical protein